MADLTEAEAKDEQLSTAIRLELPLFAENSEYKVDPYDSKSRKTIL